MTEKYKDGWEILQTKDVLVELKETISDGKEQDRIVDIMTDLLTKCPEEVSWYMAESHSGVEGVLEPEEMYETLPDEFHTVYDSSMLNDTPPSGYNIVSKGYGPLNEETRERDIFICLSMNGSHISSALSEYFKFTIYIPDRYGE